MRIKTETHNKILHACSAATFETGGILGGRNNVISEFLFDEGLASGTAGCYHPDTNILNQCLMEWQHQKIDFYGIVHSHFTDIAALSQGDKEYIRMILLAMPPEIKSLYFPLVLPEQRMIAFKAKRSGKTINITSDGITIL